jgi:hypothetical protein
MRALKTQYFLGDWSDANEVASSFDTDEPMKVNILLACYTYEDYSGDAWVLFEQDGKLYEASGGHCSCNGLEGQWEPEEVTLPVLKMRNLDYGSDYYDSNKDWAKAQTALKDIIRRLELREKRASKKLEKAA